MTEKDMLNHEGNPFAGLSRFWENCLPDAHTAVYCARFPEANSVESQVAPQTLRQWQWQESRRCELQVHEALLAKGASANAILSSISHSENWTVAVGAAQKNAQSKVLRGVGLDIESSRRAVSHRVSDRITGEEERNFPLTPLEVWVSKEACWKSVPGNTGTVVWEVCIKSYDAETKRGRFVGPRGLAQGEFQLCHLDGWVVGLAAAYKP